MSAPDLIAIAAILVGLVGPALRDPSADDPVAGSTGRIAISVAIALTTFGALSLVAGVRGFAIPGYGARLVFVVIPAVVLGALAFGPARPSRTSTMLAFTAVATTATGIYAVHVEPMWLRVDNVDVEVDAASQAPALTVAVLADLQTDGVGDHERNAIDAIVAADPDLVLITGDVFQGTQDQFLETRHELRTQLRRLHGHLGVYFVEGDSDRYDRITWLLEGTGITRLDDEMTTIETTGQRIHIGGNRIDWTTEAARGLRAEMSDLPRDDLVLLMAHRPDAVLDLPPESAIDLTLAGHTHGGQVVVPGFGPLVTFSNVSRDIARGGLGEVNGNQIYVSSGVGVERAPAPRLRLFSRPSVGILRLFPS